MFSSSSDPDQDAAELLLNSPVFAGVPDASRRALVRQLNPQDAAPGETLFTQGEPGDTLWMVAVGEVVLTRATAGGDTAELDRAGPGQMFGELDIIAPGPRSSTATALAPSRLLVLRRGVFRQLLNERDPAAEALLRALTTRVCHRLRRLDARIALLSDARRGADADQLARRLAELDAGAPAPASPPESL